jgi:hypothetical protein
MRYAVLVGCVVTAMLLKVLLPLVGVVSLSQAAKNKNEKRKMKKNVVRNIALSFFFSLFSPHALFLLLSFFI